MKMSTTLIISGLAITVAGAALSAYQALQSESESDKDKAKAETYQRDNARLLTELKQKSELIASNSNENLVRSNSLLDSTSEVLRKQNIASETLTKQVQASSEIRNDIINTGKEFTKTLHDATAVITDNLTGGESYTIVSIVNTGKREFRLAVKNQFSNNLPNVILKVENYSEIEKCHFEQQNNMLILDSECYNNNHITVPAASYNSNINYFISGEQFIDTSGAPGKLAIMIITPKHTFYQEIFYQVVQDNRINSSYRILKKLDSKYLTVANDGAFNDDQWDELFHIPIEVHINKLK